MPWRDHPLSRLPKTLSNSERVLLICLLMILAFTAFSSTRPAANQALQLQASTATAVNAAQTRQQTPTAALVQPESLILSNEMLLGATILVLIIVGGSLGTTGRGRRLKESTPPPPPPPPPPTA